MSETLEKVLGVKRLPLFPLPVVLLPNEPLPLHIFEPRYRQMLKDIRLEKNLFGLSYFDPESAGNLTAPEIGSVGCVAEVRRAQTLDDGRSNILTVGVIRYVLEGYVEAGEPYLVGEISFFEDNEEDDSILNPLAAEVLTLFGRMTDAVREISGDRERLPDLSQVAPQELSFLIAATFNFGADLKYQILKTRSTVARLERLREALRQAVVKTEETAQTSKVAKTNGHSKKKIDFE